MNKPIETLKAEFAERGYVIIDTDLPEAVLEGAKQDLSNYFGEEREHPVNVPHADHNRVQDAWYISQNALAIAQSDTVATILAGLYGRPALPFQTLNFYTGTEQPVHADSIHFNSEPFGDMCGVWVALEDIGPDQGPLIYFPGSHELPEMNYDHFGLEPGYERYPQYLGELEKIIAEKGYQPELGLIKKGQAVVWCANILHGGSQQFDKSLTRQSQVTHYYVEGSKYWRPSESKKRRHYFTPDWVRDVSGEDPRFPIKPISEEAVVNPISFARRVKNAIVRRVFNR